MSDRAVRALMDVVAVERLAPGMVRVVTWSDAYVVDARGEGCACPDKEYNLDGEGRCKHEIAAMLATTDTPAPYTPTDSLMERGGNPQPVMTDGGVMGAGNQPQGIDQWTVWDPEKENAHHFESRADAEERIEKAKADFDVDAELYGPGEAPEVLYHGDVVTNGDVDNVEDAEAEAAQLIEAVDDSQPTESMSAPAFADGVEIDSDPLDVLPGWMITQVSYNDRGDSSTTINKRGCQVIAEYLGLDMVDRDPIKRAHETDFEFATYEITMQKPDGRTFTGVGTARADDTDQGESAGWKLDMMAETRAYKRAVKSATGGGIEAFAKERNGGGGR